MSDINEPVPQSGGRPVTAEDLQGVVDTMEILTLEAQMLRHEVRVIDDKSKRDRNTRIFQSVTLAAMAFLLAGLVAVGLENRENGDLVRDCITPQGECAKRTSQAQAALTLAITYRTEAERLKTEIQVATAKGDQVAVDARTVRLASIQKLIDEQIDLAGGSGPLVTP